jgi:hypothetical protein
MGTHYSYDQLLELASPADEAGYRYLTLDLGKFDTCDNPASTKRVLYGPSRWEFQIHPSGITFREIPSTQAGTSEYGNVKKG